MRGPKKYLITLGIGCALVLWIAWSRDVFQQSYGLQVLHILCDAFFAVGALISAAGLLVFINNEGTFDLLVYGTKSLANQFRRNDIKKYDSFYDYRSAREEKKSPFLFLLLCGGFFLAVSGVLYYCYSLQL